MPRVDWTAKARAVVGYGREDEPLYRWAARQVVEGWSWKDIGRRIGCTGEAVRCRVQLQARCDREFRKWVLQQPANVRKAWGYD